MMIVLVKLPLIFKCNHLDILEAVVAEINLEELGMELE